MEPAELPTDSVAAWTADPQKLQQELVQAQKMEALGQLVSGVAHELNNPLAAIIAFSQLIRRDPRLPDDLRRDAELLVQEADRTRRIVQGLLDFARQRPPERHPTPLRALVDSVLDLQAYPIASAQVSVEVAIPDDLPRVPLDRAPMQQVLLNLTLNAIQAIRSRGGRGRLRIEAALAGQAGTPGVRLAITDDGPGVRPEHRERLFLPFFTTKEPGEGTGLGLPISLGIVAAHGGDLRYEPAPGGGATFVIELPLVVAGAIELDVAPPGPSVQDLPGVEDAGDGDGLGPRSRPRVLVVDDEPSIRRFLAKALAIAGCDALLAEDGARAVELARETPVDAALCDHRMAGMTGTDVYAALVAARPELARRFVFMSGDVLNPALREFADERGLALLAKPFDIASVGRTIRSVLDDGADRRGAQARG